MKTINDAFITRLKNTPDDSEFNQKQTSLLRQRMYNASLNRELLLQILDVVTNPKNSKKDETHNQI